MKVSNIAAQKLLDEFTKSKVVVTFSDKLIQQTFTLVKNADGSEIIGEPNTFSTKSRPFSITINDQFISPMEESPVPDPQYISYIENLKDKVIVEIENNINLRIGKWEILNYLTNLEFKLKEIRNKFKMEESEVEI